MAALPVRAGSHVEDPERWEGPVDPPANLLARTGPYGAMVDITQEQIRNRVDALLGERLALAQQNFTEEIWRIGDDFNAKGMLGGSAFSHVVCV